MIYNDDHGLSIMSQKLMGQNYKQFVFKNLLKVHARRHPKKRLYVLEENNPNSFGDRKNNKFNEFKSMSDENIEMLLRDNNKRFNRYEDLKKWREH